MLLGEFISLLNDGNPVTLCKDGERLITLVTYRFEKLKKVIPEISDIKIGRFEYNGSNGWYSVEIKEE